VAATQDTYTGAAADMPGGVVLASTLTTGVGPKAEESGPKARCLLGSLPKRSVSAMDKRLQAAG